MNVSELISLADWLRKSVPKAVRAYKPFQQKLQNNAQQGQKQPLEEELEALRDYLARQRLHELSDEQLDMLDGFGILSYVGEYGLEFIDKVLDRVEFDPATANQRVTEAIQALEDANGRADKIHDALDIVEMPEVELEAGRVLMRVRFDGDASIDNMVDLKAWATNWHDISRGIAMAAGESPADVRVVEAGRGSLILVLSTSLAVTMLLGVIVRIVTERARSIVILSNDIEDLRHKKVLNKAIEDAMNARVKEIRDGTVEAVTKDVEGMIGEKTDTAALNKAIKNLLDFTRKGGDLDFVTPPQLEELPAEEQEEGDGGEEAHEATIARRKLIEQTDEVREMIEEIREHKDDIKLLIDATHNREQ